MNAKPLLKWSLPLLMIQFMVLATGCLETRRSRDDVNAARQVSETIPPAQKMRADNDSRLDEMQQDMRVFAGRLEALEHNQGQGADVHKQEIMNLRQQVEATNERIKLLEQHVEAMEMRIMAAINMAEKAGPPAGGSAASAGAGGGAGAVVAAPVGKAGGKGAAGAASGGGEEAGGDAFAEGDKHFQNKEWRKAIVSYNKFRDKNPKSKNAAEATYKIGVAFAEMGMKKEAKAFFEQTLNDYAGSGAARKAKYRLSNMK